MKIQGTHYRTIWPHADGNTVEIIDQTQLPHVFATVKLSAAKHAAEAIRSMMVRGAPLIGATAAYGIAFAMREDASDDALDAAHDSLLATRPTAGKVRGALARRRDALRNRLRADRAEVVGGRRLFIVTLLAATTFDTATV